MKHFLQRVMTQAVEDGHEIRRAPGVLGDQQGWVPETLERFHDEFSDGGLRSGRNSNSAVETLSVANAALRDSVSTRSRAVLADIRRTMGGCAPVEES